MNSNQLVATLLDIFSLAKYAYPAIFTKESDSSYSINFPDLEGCCTCGDSLEDGIEMAEDALALVLYGYEKDARDIPAPSTPASIQLNDNEFINYIACDTMEYRKLFNSKSIKKHLLFRNGSMKPPVLWESIFLRYCKKHFYRKYRPIMATDFCRKTRKQAGVPHTALPLPSDSPRSTTIMQLQ